MQYDPAIPTLKSVLGHEPGDAITTPDEIGRYLEALAKAAPDRTRLVKYATSWEGRPLHYLIVGSPERMARLDEIKRGMQVLAPAHRTRIGSSPSCQSSSGCCTACTATRSRRRTRRCRRRITCSPPAGTPMRISTLREALVIIDPMQNPDGRQRFVTQNLLGRSRRSRIPNPQSAEHDEPWPGGRVESLPLRHEPRLLRAVAARDAGPREA